MIAKGNQIAMLCRKDSDEKVIAKKIKPYKQWLEDIKKVKGVVAKQVDSTKEYEFEIVPLYQIYYNEESLFGIYTFCTAEDLPECKPYNNNVF